MSFIKLNNKLISLGGKLLTIPSNIVTDGLVLHLDAGNSSSYPGSGSIWYDISGSGNNGTLISSPLYSTGTDANFNFNGSSQRVNLGQIFNYTTSNFTFSCWVNFNSLSTNQLNQGPIIFFKGAYTGNGYYFQMSYNGIGGTFVSGTIGTIGLFSVLLNTWYNISITKNSTSVNVYVNGINVTSTHGTHNITSSSYDFTLASYNTTQILMNGKISNFMNYNRNLTPSEIQHNYNALKNRYL